jgi:hypothetical protein
MRLAFQVCLKNIGDCMGSHNGSNSIDTTHTPLPLSFYNTFKLSSCCLHYNTMYNPRKQDRKGWRGGGSNRQSFDTYSSKLLEPIDFFCKFILRPNVCWLLLCLCRPFSIFESCLDSNLESSRSKQAR